MTCPTGFAIFLSRTSRAVAGVDVVSRTTPSTRTMTFRTLGQVYLCTCIECCKETVFLREDIRIIRHIPEDSLFFSPH